MSVGEERSLCKTHATFPAYSAVYDVCIFHRSSSEEKGATGCSFSQELRIIPETCPQRVEDTDRNILDPREERILIK